MINASVQEFQRQVLSEWAATTVALMQISAAKKGLHDTGELINSIGYRVFSAGASAMGLDISFNQYGRILDMTRNQATPTAVNKAILLGGKTINARKNAVSKNWYSKVVFPRIYGSGNNESLIEKLTEGYALWALERITQEFSSLN